MRFIKKFLLDIAFDYVPFILLLILAVIYIRFFPEYWGRLMLITIPTVFYFSVKFFIKIETKLKSK